jgi:hypothetical protein
MPQNLTDSDAFTSPVVAPADTDAANAASIVQGLQPLANRTHHHNLLIKTTGVPRIRSGTSATMVALTGQNNGDMFVVTSSGAPQGLYFYQAAGAHPVDSMWVYTATGMGAGQWVHANYVLLNANLGFAAVGPVSGFSGVPANRISETFVPMRNVNVIYATPSTGGAVNNATTTYADITGYSTTVPDTEPGDLLLIDMALQVWDQPAHFGSFLPTVVDGAATNALGVEVRVGPASAGSYYALSPVTYSTAYPVVTGGTITVKAQFKTDSAGGDCFANSTGGSRIRVLHIKP